MVGAEAREAVEGPLARRERVIHTVTYGYASVWFMPAQARTPRSDWIAAGLNALARGGPEAVRVEPLARELGATMGVAQTFAGLARVAAPLLATMAFQRLGHGWPFFLAGGCVAVVGILAFRVK